MDPRIQYFDEVCGLPDDALYRVRGVPGVEWAVQVAPRSWLGCGPVHRIEPPG